MPLPSSPQPSPECAVARGEVSQPSPALNVPELGDGRPFPCPNPARPGPAVGGGQASLPSHTAQVLLWGEGEGEGAGEGE